MTHSSISNKQNLTSLTICKASCFCSLENQWNNRLHSLSIYL